MRCKVGSKKIQPKLFPYLETKSETLYNFAPVNIGIRVPSSWSSVASEHILEK